MFSGIIQGVGKIVAFLSNSGGGATLVIRNSIIAKTARPGDSVAVDGVCFTLLSAKGNRMSFDVSPETLHRTNLKFRKNLPPEVNLELPVTAGTLLSGHIVQGHVDGIGTVQDLLRKGEDVRLRVALPTEFMEYCVAKGSIAINGVSLTIAGISRNVVEIALIPYTLDHTNLGSLRKGDAVNIETDVLGKYVVSALKKTYDKARFERASRPRKLRSP
jgi:riboflavin synthase